MDVNNNVMEVNNNVMDCFEPYTMDERLELAASAFKSAHDAHIALDDKTKSKPPSLREFAREYDIKNHTTLLRRIQGTTKSRKEAHIDDQALTPHEEIVIVKWILQLEIWGWPARVCQVRLLAQDLLWMRKPDVEIGKTWVNKFLTRHTELKSAFTRAKDKERVAAESGQNIEHWFKLYADLCNRFDIPEDDRYNMDEKGFAMGLLNSFRVICSRREKNASLRQPGNRHWVSLIECVSSKGFVLSPWVIFKGKQQQTSWQQEFLKAGMRGTTVVSDNGWTNNEIGLLWLQRVFEPETRLRKTNTHRLLIVDGHDSHVTVEAIQFCVSHDIVLVCLPPHATHLLQPLDVGVFLPLSTYYSGLLEARCRFGSRNISKETFLELYLQARKLAISQKNVTSSWAKSGLVPYNPDVVLSKLPVLPRSRPITPPTATASNEVADLVPFTPSNPAQATELCLFLNKKGADANATKKLGNALNSTFAEIQSLKVINQALVEKANEGAMKKGSKGNQGKARWMNTDVFEERQQKTAKVNKDKQDKKNEKDFWATWGFASKLWPEERLRKTVQSKQKKEDEKEFWAAWSLATKLWPEERQQKNVKSSTKKLASKKAVDSEQEVTTESTTQTRTSRRGRTIFPSRANKE